MDRVSRKRLARLQKQEARVAAKYEKAKPSVFAAVQDKIPDGLRGKLEAAFAKGFRLVLEKGSGLIGKTYDADGLRQEYEARERALSERVTGGRLRRLRARSRAAVQGGTGIALAEGAALGVLGIGLPDIPLFLAGLLRGLYRIALSFGFDPARDGERCYLLLLIAVSLSRGEARERYTALADRPRRRWTAAGRFRLRWTNASTRQRRSWRTACSRPNSYRGCRSWASRAVCRMCRSTGALPPARRGLMKSARCCAGAERRKNPLK